MSDYTPVSCELQDELEAIATLQKSSTLTYRSESGNTTTAEAKIVDIYAENGADYCKLSDGTVIRLDYLESVKTSEETVWEK